MIEPRDEAHLFLLELWVEHQRITNGTELKIWLPKVDKGFYFLNKEKQFQFVKPLEFKQADDYLSSLNIGPLTTRVGIIEFADNRMIQGDVRYPSNYKLNFDMFDVVEEYHKRFTEAIQRRCLELLIDAYNMARIQYYKDHNYDNMTSRARHVVMRYVHAIHHAIGWTFDDKSGIHANEKHK